MKTKRIDIVQEFVELSQHEDMLAFFQFTMRKGGHDRVTGLCRISKPKRVAGGTSYLALTLMADTADEVGREVIDAAVSAVARDLQTAVPAIEAVVPLPAMTSSPDTYVRQLDVMLKAHIDPGKPFVAERLIPALQRIGQIMPVEVVWWEDAISERVEPAASRKSASLVERVRARLREYLSARPKET